MKFVNSHTTVLVYI